MTILSLEPPAVLAARLRARAGATALRLRIAAPLELDDEQRHALELDAELDRAAAAALDRLVLALLDAQGPFESDEPLPF